MLAQPGGTGLGMIPDPILAGFKRDLVWPGLLRSRSASVDPWTSSITSARTSPDLSVASSVFSDSWLKFLQRPRPFGVYS